jgi:3-(3-hydroxy-phenyl)propionate hydroxylase
MADHAVAIAGGGPTGLMPAGELAVAGGDVAIVERRASQDVIGSRAGEGGSGAGEERGPRSPVLARVAQFAGIGLDIGGLPARNNFGLGRWQNQIERILADWVGGYTVPTYRGSDVTGFAPDGTGVDVELSDGQSLRAGYLVGCDAGRGRLRKAGGIAFSGNDPTPGGTIGRDDSPDGGQEVRVLVTDGPDAQALVVVWQKDYGRPGSTSSPRDADLPRRKACHRQGRVLLASDGGDTHEAGDAASPPSLDTGVHDAAILGWTLAQVVHGTAPQSRLDTYHLDGPPLATHLSRTSSGALVLAFARASASRPPRSNIVAHSATRWHRRR